MAAAAVRDYIRRMLRPELSRERQKRLLATMAKRKLDAIAIGLPHDVYYLSAFLPGWLHYAGFILFADGRSWLTTANKPAAETAADDVQSYEAQWNATLRQEQPTVVAEQMIEALRSRQARRIGIDASAVTSNLAMRFDGEVESIDDVLWQQRRRKDDDELELMKKAIRCTESMYARAREIVEPGVQELDVFNELHAAAVREAGETLTTILGNDFTCGGGGGPPRKDRAAKAEEIYILDLGPCFRGYFADNCRAIAVDRKPTDAQLKSHEAILEGLKIVERMAKPGARCSEIYQAVADHLKRATGKELKHHLGHGVGLQPHEYPHFNPKWDDTLIEGEIFSAEPGLYGPDLAGGIRIESNYLVTAAGVVNLLNSPMELA
jgi:Xaa-Pro aminopeptidase